MQLTHPALAPIHVATLALALSIPSAAQDASGGPASRRRAFESGPVAVEELARDASVIVRGVIASSEAKWVGRVIYTQYAVVVQETLKGSAQSSITIAVPGGTLGNVALSIPQAPTLGAGDEVVFFGQQLAGTSAFRAVGTFAGLIPVTPSAAQGATVAPRGRPENLDDFWDEVRTLGRRP